MKRVDINIRKVEKTKNEWKFRKTGRECLTLFQKNVTNANYPLLFVLSSANDLFFLMHIRDSHFPFLSCG